MSTATFPKGERIDRPQVIDQGSLKRIQQIIPVVKAALPIVEHNIELIDTAKSLRPWYVGSVMRTPHELMSTLLDPNLNSAARMLSTFISTVKRFEPGTFPGHCETVRQLEFTTVQLIRTLMTLIDSPAFVDALRHFNDLFATICDPTNFLLSEDELCQKLDKRLILLVETFGEISKAFRLRERERDIEYAFRKMPSDPASKEEVREIVDSAASSAADKVVAAVEKGAAKVAKAVKKSQVKGRKPRTKVDIQEAVWNIHERVKTLQAVKDMHPKGMATRENEFLYAKGELKSIGIASTNMYTSTLNARIKRVSRKVSDP